MRMAGWIFLFVATALSLRAAGTSAEAAFRAANQLYERGKYAEAAKAYESLQAEGTVSAAVYFNLGNAWFKAGQKGRALAALAEARLLSPRDGDVQANIYFIREQAGGGQARDFWDRWLMGLSLNEWSIFSLVATLVCSLLLAARSWSDGLKRTLKGYTAISAIVALGITASMCFAAHRQLIQRNVVVIAPEAVVHRGPFDESPAAFSARDGTELAVVTVAQEWIRVDDAQRRTGWVKVRDVLPLGQIPGKVKQ